MILKFSLLSAILLSSIGCGVKGDPEPPLEPPRIGRGSAGYVPIQDASSLKDPAESERDPEKENEKR